MNNKTTFLITFLITILCLPMANAQIKLPNIPETQFLITNYGADASSLDNSAAINAAITAANSAGGGAVVIPANTFLSGPITMKSNVNLYISAGAILQFMPYGEGNGLPAGSYPNNGTANSYSNFIYGENLDNIEISGTGIVEGNGEAWWKAFKAKAVGKRPCMIRFKACHTVLVKDVTLQNSPGVHLTFGQKGESMGSDGTILNVTIKAPSTSPNTDAVDTWFWNGVDILNCNFSVGDDNVAMDAGSQNITIKDCTFGTGHGVSVGSFTTDVQNVIVDNCTFTDTTNGIRLKSGTDRGGNETTFSYSNITMKNVKYPFYITCWYPKEPTDDPSTLTAGAVTATTPTWKNISFKNITVTNSVYAGIIFGLPESYVNNVVFDNVKIEATKKGMVTNFVNGLVFKNNSSITIPSDRGDAVLNYAATISGINTTSGVSTH
jgi:polygalacturonase